MNLDEMNAMPLYGLAHIANSERNMVSVRMKAANALASRLHEMNGVGWLQTPASEKAAIRAALADTMGRVIPAFPATAVDHTGRVMVTR